MTNEVGLAVAAITARLTEEQTATVLAFLTDVAASMRAYARPGE